jgi:aldehyde dehydrogenase (NAD+)
MILGSHYIAGKWVKRGDFVKINPSTEEIIASIPQANNNEIDMAVIAAQKAFQSWRKVSRVKRADYLFALSKLVEENKTTIADKISLETGKSKNESLAEVIEALHMCQVAFSSGRNPYGNLIASEIAEKDAYVIRKPKGVVGVISPWNFPCAVGSFWSAAPAIVEGNTVVHKPSELTPLTAQYIAELYEKAGFPEGVYNLIHGDGIVGEKLVKHNINCILFTGSYEVGKSIQQECVNNPRKSCSCETGSKSATIVFADGNQNLALEVAVASAFKLSGQRCVSSGRILVERSIYSKFCDSFAERASKLLIGDPFQCNAFFGPLISQEQRERVEKYNNMVDQGIMLKGKRIIPKGYFLSPHVYQANWEDKPYLKQEVFGPHVALIPFDSVEEAIYIHNDTDFGLAVGVVTDDFRKMRVLREDLRAGMSI